MARWPRASHWAWLPRKGSHARPTRTPRADCTPYVQTRWMCERWQRLCYSGPVMTRLWRNGSRRTKNKATMGTPDVQAVFDLLYAFRDEVSRVTGVRMPSGMDPQYPYGHADTEASLC